MELASLRGMHVTSDPTAPMMTRAGIVLAAAFGMATGCVRSTLPGTDATVTVTPSVEQAEGRTAYTVSWDTPEVSDTQLVYGEGDAFDQTASGTSADGLHHEVELLGLAGGVTWQARVDGVGEQATYTSDALELPPPLPDDLPALDVKVPASADVSGYSVTVLVTYPGAVVVVLDSDGRYVFWQAVDSIAGFRAVYDAPSRSVYWLAEAGTDPSANASALWRCALDGQPELVAELPQTHHDLTVDPDGGWYVLAYDEREVEGEGDDLVVRGDELLHISPDGQDIATVWDSWDQFPYAGESMEGSDRAEYPHTNSVIVDPDSGELVLSLYMTDTLVWVDPSTGRVDAEMGGDDSDWTFTDGEAFAHQHSPVLLDDDARLLIFDNGSGGNGDPSEAAMYDLDWSARTAARSWSYDEGGAHRNVTAGSVVRVDDAGDMLVAWGSDAALTQVSAAGEVDWEAQWPGSLVGFTSHLASLDGTP